MKKNRWLLVTCLAALLMTGCTQGKAVVKSTVKQQESKSAKPSAEQIVLTGTGGMADEVYTYKSYAERQAAAAAVVLGTVVDMRYGVLAYGVIYTEETIRIDEMLSGTISSGEELVVRKDGGYATVQEMIDSYGEDAQSAREGLFKDFIDQDMTSIYVHQVLPGDKDSELGDQTVYFLQADPQDKNSGLYIPVDAEKSMLPRLADGRLLRTGMIGAKEIRAILDGDQALLEKYQAALITMDELKAQLTR